jgi:Sugar (and other) transporter
MSRMVVEILIVADFSVCRSNFVVAITFPRLLGSFKPQGAFGWYAGWNIVGFVAILLFVPETKALSLEELDQGKHIHSLPLFRRRPILFTHPLFSLLCADAHTCGISDQGAAAQHQEIYLPHEGRPYTAPLRT